MNDLKTHAEKSRFRGRVVEWDDAKGFGYVSSANGKLFIHIRDFSERIKRPAVGDKLSFAVGKDVKGRRCAVHALREGYGGRFGWGSLIGLVMLVAAPAYVVWWLFPLEMARGIGVWFLFASLVTFWVYRLDKRKAQRGQWREPEKMMHLAELVGGWPGAYVAQRVFRHKSSKLGFQFVFWLIVLLYQYVAIDALLGWKILDFMRNAVAQL